MVQTNNDRRKAAFKRAIITSWMVVLSCVLHARSWVHLGSERYHVVTTAQAEVGVREQGGNNKGKRVKEYLAATGLKEGYAWCSAFVAWVYNQCNVQHKVTAWSPSATPEYNRVWQRGRRDNHTPLPGDAFSLYYANLGRIGHAGFVVEWSDKWVTTIEGNTNGDGSRDGDGVHLKKRMTSTIYRVSRWIR